MQGSLKITKKSIIQILNIDGARTFYFLRHGLGIGYLFRLKSTVKFNEGH